MTDQQPGGPGNSGSWQPVPGGGDYDPDQTMHVSFAAQLPPEPRPGEDPLSAHGPVGYQEHPGGPGQPGPGPDGRGDGGPVDPEAVTSWSIPVIRDDVEPDSGEYSVGAFAPSWDEVPSPAAPTQSFPAGMFGQGAAAAAQARAAQAQGPQAPDTQAPETHGQGARMRGGAAGGDLGHLSGQWTTPFTGPEGGDAVPWLPAHAPAADASWSGVVDDPDSPVDPGSAAYGHPGDESEPAVDASAGYTAVADAPRGRYAPGEAAGPLPDAETAHPGPVDELPGAHGFPATGDPAVDGRGADAPGTDPYGADGFGADAHVPGAHVPDAQGPDGHGAHGEDTYADGGRDPDAFTDPDPSADALGFPADGRRGDPADPADPSDPSGQADPTGHDALAAADESAEDVFEPEPEPAAEPVEETRSEHPLASYMLRVNGTDRPVTDAWLGESLLYVLRERLGLAGAKDGCEQGECGACSVQVDGRLVASCLVPAATAAGSEVRTVEGLTVEGRPSDVQQALADCGAVQCGFCIPGMAMTVHDLLEGNHKPTELDVRQALSGNLCRCSGYRGVLDAVRQVVTGRETDDDPATDDDFVRVPHQGGPGQGGPGQGGPGHSSSGQGIPGQGGPTGAAGGAL